MSDTKEPPFCPKCYSLFVDFEWMPSAGAYPEWEQGVCHECDHEWNECAREDI